MTLLPALALANADLRPLADQQKFTLGCAVPIENIRNNVDDGKFVDTLRRNFNLVEPENDFKPPAIWTGPREYNFKTTDFLLGEPGKKGWAQDNKMKVRGHVLVYASDGGYTLPDWLRQKGADLSKEEAAQLLKDYIKTVVGRYKGKIAMWDVINEAIEDRPNSNPFNLRNSYWFRKLGPEFMVMAFKWAREADPKAELYYNDYGVESGGRKGQNLLDLVKWLKEQGAPITGVGLQYHLVADMKVKPDGPFYKYVDSIANLGLDYMVTELDVAIPMKNLPTSDPARGRVPAEQTDIHRQAEVYGDVFRMARDTRRCRGINIWGLSDGHSWIPGFSRGRNGLATIFDFDFYAKPAHQAIVDFFQK